MCDLSKIQFVFIIGAPRSGTTWLYALIGNHPDVAATPEVEQTFFSRYLPPVVEGWETELYHIKRGAWVQGLPYLWTEEEFDSFVQYFLEKVYVKILEKKPDARIIIDKAPEYSHHVKLIKRFVPNAKFIHIVRDGRAVASSVMPLDWGPNTIINAAHFWAEKVCYGLAAESSYKELVMRVKYEDLVSNPVDTLKKLCSWLNLEYETNMVSGTGFKVTDYCAKQHALIGEKPNRSRINAWISNLKDREIEIFESLTDNV